MGVLSDTEIRRRAQCEDMITPFAEGDKRPGVISFGLSSFGYDMRVGGDFEVFSPGYTGEAWVPCTDPKEFNPGAHNQVLLLDGEALFLPPHSFALGVSVERFKIPRDIITICLGKSTYARCGLYVNITPFEPEWEGYATVELTNPTPRTIKVYAGEGIAQLIFLQAGFDLEKLVDYAAARAMDRPIDAPKPWSDGKMGCERSYRDKCGKYQDQERKVVHPKVDGV